MLPRVESPIPDTIGVYTIIGSANAGGVLLFVVATMLRFPDAKRDAWGKVGIVLGFGVGLGFYLVTLVAQLL